MRLLTIQSLTFQGRFQPTYDTLGEKSLFNVAIQSINFTHFSCIIILRNESLKGQEHPLQNETNAGNLIRTNEIESQKQK